MSMAEIDRLNELTTWIGLSFVERDRTPRWAIEVGVRYHLSGMSLLEESNFLDVLASTGVTSPFVSELIKLIYSRSRQFLRIRLQLTKR